MAQIQGFHECLNALRALFSPETDSAVKNKASTWLISFQQKKEVWQVSDEILRRPGLPEGAYFYAANSIRAKLQLDFHELKDPKSRLVLRDSLLQHLHRFKAGPPTVRARVAMCIGTIAVHLSGEWKDCLGMLSLALGKPETALCLLDVLAASPEECRDRKLQVENQLRHRHHEYLRSFAPKLLNILFSYLKSAGRNRELQKRVLSCFASWIKHNTIDPELLPKDSLFNTLFEALKVPELFSLVTEVFAEVMRQTSDVHNHKELVTMMINRILALQPLYDKFVKESDIENAKVLANLFSEMGESYVYFVMELSPTAVNILTLMLKCLSNKDKEVALTTFYFWEQIPSELKRMQDDKQVETYKSKFSKFYITCCQEIVGFMRLPKNYESLEEEQKERIKKLRSYAADTLLDICEILGATTVLELFCKGLKNEASKMQEDVKMWHGVEACLHSIRAIARNVAHQESQFLPQVMNILPKLSINPQIVYTSIIIIGRYADWLKLHPEHLQNLLPFVVRSLALNDKNVITQSTVAIKYIGESCHTYVARNSIDVLFNHVYTKIKSMTLSQQINVILGVGNIVSALPKDKLLEYAKKFIYPLAQELGNLVKRKTTADPLSFSPISDSGGKDDHEGASSALDRLAEAFKALNPSYNEEDDVVSVATVELLKQLWKLLEALLALYKDDSDRLEKVSRIYRYAIRACGKKFLPMLQTFLTLVINHYKKHPHASLLYLLSICVDIFHSTPPTFPLLNQSLNEMCNVTFTILKDQESAKMNPDFTEDFFEMCHRYVKKAPTLFLQNPNIPKIMNAAVFSVEVEHSEASSALMQFLGRLFGLGIDSPRENQRRGAESLTRPQKPTDAYCQVLEKILKQYGEGLLGGLLRAIAGSVPESRLEYLVGALEALLSFRPATKLPTAWITAPVEKIKYADDEDRKAFLTRIMRAQDPRAIREAVYRFSDDCRRKVR